MSAPAPTGGCGADPATAVDLEPDWRQYGEYRTWTDRAGCPLRIDVLTDADGPEHCGWQAARVIGVSREFGKPYANPAGSLQYVRDPEGVFGRTELATGFDPDAALPAEAVDSGFRHASTELWRDPADLSAIWLRTGEQVERWPQGERPLCE